MLKSSLFVREKFLLASRLAPAVYISMGLNLETGPERKEAIMRTHALLEDADGLIALAESVATVFSEKHHELNINTEIEALLRASIAGTTDGINIYLSALAHASKSSLARKYLAE